jgi:hypothetical protein
MTIKIDQLDVRIDLKDPTEPTVWIGVVAEGASPSVDVRGRLMGPRCRYSSTVEVAYPWRTAPRTPAGLTGIVRRAVIPEASQWEPTHPFIYEGPVELWDGEQLCDERRVRCGIRYVHLGNRGLRLNGRLFTLRGVQRNTCSAEEMATLRDQGVNLLVVDVAQAAPQLWADADVVGIFVLGKVGASGDAIAQACARQTHPSNFGWIIDATIFDDRSLRDQAAPLLQRRAGELIGIHSSASGETPPEVQFVVGPPDSVRALPCLALSSEDLPESPGLFGTVRP